MIDLGDNLFNVGREDVVEQEQEDIVDDYLESEASRMEGMQRRNQYVRYFNRF